MRSIFATVAIFALAAIVAAAPIDNTKDSTAGFRPCQGEMFKSVWCPDLTL
ncbi:hypothetical protein BC828DRAFT_405729 [Blastocladiella britannica]|nr:hypothetical protein BC828DRAFT_405729 [Blastocladiella britannica]